MQRTTEVLSHISELDGVRGIAVLIVMIIHFYAPVRPSLPFGPLDKFLVHGSAGVDIFFVLSGFLITSILIATKPAQNYFRAFYARRVLRILPLYAVVMIAFFWIAVPVLHHLGKELWIAPREQLYYWSFLANWRLALRFNDGAQLSHFWSLAVEEQFYILWSIVVWFASPRAIKNISIAVAAGSFGLHLYGVFFGWSSEFLYFSTVTRIDCLALGSLLAVSPGFRQWVGKYALVFLPLAIVAAVLTTSERLYFPSHDLGATALVALAVTRSVPLLRMEWLRSFGRYSYALYVFHYPIGGVFWLVRNRFNPLLLGSVSILGGIALSYLAARISWKYLEQPCLRLKAKFNYRCASPQGPQTGPQNSQPCGRQHPVCPFQRPVSAGSREWNRYFDSPSGSTPLIRPSNEQR